MTICVSGEKRPRVALRCLRRASWYTGQLHVLVVNRSASSRAAWGPVKAHVPKTTSSKLHVPRSVGHTLWPSVLNFGRSRRHELNKVALLVTW